MEKIFNSGIKEDNLRDEYNVATLESLNVIERNIDNNFKLITTSSEFLIGLEHEAINIAAIANVDDRAITLENSINHINFIYTLLGIEKVSMGTESHDMTNLKTVTLEDISATLKKAKDRVLEILSKIIKSIKKFFKRIWNFLFGQNKKTEKRKTDMTETSTEVRQITDAITTVINTEKDAIKQEEKIDEIVKDAPETIVVPAKKIIQNANSVKDKLIKLIPKHIVRTNGNFCQVTDNVTDVVGEVDQILMVIGKIIENGIMIQSNDIDNLSAWSKRGDSRLGIIRLTYIGDSQEFWFDDDPEVDVLQRITFQIEKNDYLRDAEDLKDYITFPTMSEAESYLGSIGTLKLNYLSSINKNTSRFIDDIDVVIKSFGSSKTPLSESDEKNLWSKYNLSKITEGEYSTDMFMKCRESAIFNSKALLSFLNYTPKIISMIDSLENIVMDSVRV